jgi:hypothetical protein
MGNNACACAEKQVVDRGLEDLNQQHLLETPAPRMPPLPPVPETRQVSPPSKSQSKSKSSPDKSTTVKPVFWKPMEPSPPPKVPETIVSSCV